MSNLERIAIGTIAGLTTIIAYAAKSLRSDLQGRHPCPRWFAFVVGVASSALVFATWTGVYGLGAAEPGPQGVAFCLWAGLILGGIFSCANSLVLWKAFDSPDRDDAVEHRQMLETDVSLLVARAVGRLRSFRPDPRFASSGWCPG